jgi:hypothetical protein
MDKSKYIYIGIIVIFLALVFYFGVYNRTVNTSSSGSVISSNQISQSDFSFSNFKYEQMDCDACSPIYYNQEIGNTEADFSMVISTQRDDLYTHVYDAKRNEKINSHPGESQKLSVGENKYYGYSGLYMNDLKSSPEIKVCVSKDYQFTMNSQGVVCKTQTFSLPEFKIGVIPNPLIFEVSKEEGTYDTERKSITITNAGNVIADVNVFISNYASQDLNYQTPKHFPQHPTLGFTPGEGLALGTTLSPGESAEFDVGVTIGNVGEFDTLTGMYETKGYVWSVSTDNTLINALFKQEFTIKTIVSP